MILYIKEWKEEWGRQTVFFKYSDIYGSDQKNFLEAMDLSQHKLWLTRVRNEQINERLANIFTLKTFEDSNSWFRIPKHCMVTSNKLYYRVNFL